MENLISLLFLARDVAQNALHIGNFMEIIADPTNTIKYLYSLQNTGTILSRALIF